MKNHKWKYKVDIKRFLKMDQGNETAAHISGISHSIAAVLRDKLPSKFFDEDNNDFCDFIDAVQSLKDVATEELYELDGYEPIDLFNDWLNTIYDFADAERIWLG